ncbi:MAG: nitrile hydratase subunit beta [Solirubrobacterales bacterium]
MTEPATRPQDIGGQDHGPVHPDPDEPVFHTEWERRTFGLSVTTRLGSRITLDRFRAYQAALPPDRYIRSSYYERWVHALERAMVDDGVLTEEEVTSLQSGPRTAPEPPVPTAELKERMLERVETGRIRFVDAASEPGFGVGDRVRVGDVPVVTYDRLPGYLRGRSGVVDEHYGSFGDPEELTAGKADVSGEHLYRVRFAASELWGSEAESPADELCVDLFERYLEAS